MKLLVCIRQGRDGEINPFDACAYEEALRLGGDVTIISMGAPSTADFMAKLSRLGAKRAILLTDKAFAGADTLATAYALSLAAKKLEPDLIFCGRQTLVGDTGQVGPMLAVKLGYSLITNVTEILSVDGALSCSTRSGDTENVEFPALITVERINTLRLPRMRSKTLDVEVWTAADIGADTSKCGLVGSPTRVLETHENQSGKRKCRLIEPSELREVIRESLDRQTVAVKRESSTEPLKKVYIVGEKPREMAESVGDDITVIDTDDVGELCEIIGRDSPSAVLFACDDYSKTLAAKVAATLDLGLCADCTALANEGGELIMYRPALSGSIIAKIRSTTRPALATVRIADESQHSIVVSLGYGAVDCIDAVKAFAEDIGAEIGASRKMVDNGYMPYAAQVGLTGRTVTPSVYVAVGVSGAVHHVAGFDRSGTVIAVNADKDAPIFEYADYGIVGDCAEVFGHIK